MPFRLAITKVSAQGEQISIDIPSWNPVTGEIVHNNAEEMSALFNEAMALADTRLLEMNMRMLEARDVRKYFDDEHWMKLVAIFDVLAGRQDITTVVQRWEDTAEENRELAEAREAAFRSSDNSICPVCNERHGYHTASCSYTSITSES